MVPIGAHKIVYVSCNPKALEGDMSFLITDGGYKIKKVQSIDMFPHTPHVETVLLLEKQ